MNCREITSEKFSNYLGSLKEPKDNLTKNKIIFIAALVLGIGFSIYASLNSKYKISLLLTAGGLFLWSSLIYNQVFSFDYKKKNKALTQETETVMKMVKPYFLAPYKDGADDKEEKWIYGTKYSVERANHGLAHGLRQGVLAKDIFNLLLNFPITDSTGIVNWARGKHKEDPLWIQKIELASSFQRSGRQQEGSSAALGDLYKEYEKQDTVNFRKETKELSLFKNESERLIFEEAILWSYRGTLDESKLDDLKYLRRILHAAHTLDLRRMLSFDATRIQEDSLIQLFGSRVPKEAQSLKKMLWDRCGEYLKATGDRDLSSGRNYQDAFFIQTKTPQKMVDAICSVYQKTFPLPSNK